MFDKVLEILKNLPVKKLVGGYYSININSEGERYCALGACKTILELEDKEELERNKENKPVLETFGFYDENHILTDQYTSMYDLLGCQKLGLSKKEALDLQEFNDKCINVYNNAVEAQAERYKKVIEFCELQIKQAKKEV